MKRYLYTILVALLFAVGCDIESFNQPDVVFYFGKVTTETTDCSAEVDVLAYMTIDGVMYDDASIYLEYWKSGEASNSQIVTDYVTDNAVHRYFTLTDLEPSTLYMVNVVIDGGQEYGSKSELFAFTTDEKVLPVARVTCDAEVVAKGIMATINLKNVAYILDDVAQTISFLKVEYSRNGVNEWASVEVAGSSIKGGNVTISIPKSGDSYLEENRDYKFRVTITPKDGELSAITTDDFKFKTTYANITANISKPQMSHSGEGITIKRGNIEVYYDGVASTDYTSSIYFREKSSSVWEQYTPTGDSVVIPAEQLKDNTTYEAKVSIVAGSLYKVCESEVASITTPKKEVPILPEPPTGGDTSAIGGVWHLTSWRGTTPSFEVYMEITATGGITLYQRIDSLYWDVYQSTAAIENGVIYGVYTDGVSWATSYSLSVAGDTMTWVSIADSTDISVYTRSSLPTSMPTAPTRAVVASERFL